MKTKRPIQAPSTERIMKAVLPSDFKMVYDKTSNGYKYINLLYGVEVDQGIDTLKEVYQNSFFTTIDLTKNFELYEVTISGVPNTNYLNDGQIKITDEFEFYNGAPTRIIPISGFRIPMVISSYSGENAAPTAGFNNIFSSGVNVQCWSSMSGFIGLEYFRKTIEGSGYLLIATDYDQEGLYLSGLYNAFICNVGTNFQSEDDYNEIYGLYTGIKDQNYTINSRNEILYPIDTKTLNDKYPLTRQIFDASGMSHVIDHYTPYHGWMFNEYNEIVANIDYSGTYYYDDDGNKIYYRTAYNNPYGYNNYSIAYLDLEHIPISGTLKVYDIDILDGDGNATEISRNGSILYYYKSPKMLIGSGIDRQFDPIYVGYDQFVPSGYGFSSNMEGHIATPLKTISWDYLHEGGGIDQGTMQYVDGSGSITNRIKITNYHTRYLVEYKYKTHDQFRYVSSIESDGAISKHTQVPIYTLNNYSGGLTSINYEFTKDPTYITREPIPKNESSKIITFDGLEVRPYKRIHRMDFNIPIIHSNGLISKKLFINTNKTYIGYTNEFVPINTNFRRYVLNCPFDQDVFLNTVTEIDLTGNGNSLSFGNTGTSTIYKINYDSYYGKRIINSNNSYFYKQNKSFLLDNTYFEFCFKLRKSENFTLMDLKDLTLDKYIVASISSDGTLSISCQGYIFICREKLSFNSNSKYITIKYAFDKISQNIPNITVYLKEDNDLSYRILEAPRSIYSSEVVASTYLHIYKNTEIDINKFAIFYEVQ